MFSFDGIMNLQLRMHNNNSRAAFFFSAPLCTYVYVVSDAFFLFFYAGLCIKILTSLMHEFVFRRSFQTSRFSYVLSMSLATLDMRKPGTCMYA